MKQADRRVLVLLGVLAVLASLVFVAHPPAILYARR